MSRPRRRLISAMVRPTSFNPDLKEHPADCIGTGHPARRRQPSPEVRRPSLPQVSPYGVTYFSPQDHMPANDVCSPNQSLHSNLSIYSPRPRAPLEDQQRAHLMRHYVDNLSGWVSCIFVPRVVFWTLTEAHLQLGLNDPCHHFAIAVPHLAMTCPMLLDAIFAFSARDLSLRLGGLYSADMADEYHDSCVHRLIPALEDLSMATESALPVSTVILRMHEMLSNEIDFQRHLRGCISLFRYNRNKFRPGSLQHTAFWTYVRQEILTALANSSATNVDTSDCTYKVVFSGETDDDWTNNITWLTAQVINYCFDPQVLSSAERWEQLHLAVESWRERLPDTFRPLSVVADDESFPIITHLCTWHGRPQY